VLGAIFTAMAVKLRQEPTTKLAMRVFTYSITYITLLFGAMALDVLVRGMSAIAPGRTGGFSCPPGGLCSVPIERNPTPTRRRVARWWAWRR
jgi:hypothetical protein